MVWQRHYPWKIVFSSSFLFFFYFYFFFFFFLVLNDNWQSMKLFSYFTLNVTISTCGESCCYSWNVYILYSIFEPKPLGWESKLCLEKKLPEYGKNLWLIFKFQPSHSEIRHLKPFVHPLRTLQKCEGIKWHYMFLQTSWYANNSR